MTEKEQTVVTAPHRAASTETNIATQLFGSKKFIALVTGILGIVLVKFAGLTEAAALDIADKLANLVMAYLGAQGLADAGRGFSGKAKG